MNRTSRIVEGSRITPSVEQMALLLPEGQAGSRGVLWGRWGAGFSPGTPFLPSTSDHASRGRGAEWSCAWPPTLCAVPVDGGLGARAQWAWAISVHSPGSGRGHGLRGLLPWSAWDLAQG